MMRPRTRGAFMLQMRISGQNADDKNANTQNPNTKNALPNPKTPTPRHISQWHLIHWRFARGIMTGYHAVVPYFFENHVNCQSKTDDSTPNYPK